MRELSVIGARALPLKSGQIRIWKLKPLRQDREREANGLRGNDKEEEEQMRTICVGTRRGNKACERALYIYVPGKITQYGTLRCLVLDFKKCHFSFGIFQFVIFLLEFSVFLFLFPFLPFFPFEIALVVSLRVKVAFDFVFLLIPILEIIWRWVNKWVIGECSLL